MNAARAEELKQLGEDSIRKARVLIEQNRGTTAGLATEADAAEQMLTGGFYVSVTAEERRAVYEAMAAEFTGTGHWYRCENGHPFTIGECGMPIEEARCPECEASVGGLDHSFTAGVGRADDMEELGRAFGRLGT